MLYRTGPTSYCLTYIKEAIVRAEGKMDLIQQQEDSTKIKAQ